jgi:hypothetical protein
MKRTTKSFALPPGISRASLEQLEGPVGGLQQRWPLQPKRVAFPMRSARLFSFLHSGEPKLRAASWIEVSAWARKLVALQGEALEFGIGFAT